MIKILLVDEDPSVALKIRLRMNTLGYQVETEQDAVPAMNQAIYESPDILVLDVNQSDGIGLAAAPKHIKPAFGYGNRPIDATLPSEPSICSSATTFNQQTFIESIFGTGGLAETGRPLTAPRHADPPHRGSARDLPAY